MHQTFNDLFVTCLSFSGGRQSTALLWMAILGHIHVDPDNFLVLNANPGMEDSRTMPHVEEMLRLARRVGFTAITVDGPNLYNDILALPESRRTRLDNPPYWTDLGIKNKDQIVLPGFEHPQERAFGKLTQKCTRYYKIEPMDRALRVYLEDRHGIPRKSKRLSAGCVEKWIGFGVSEVARIKPSKQKYIRFRYPLIEQRVDTVRFFDEIGKPMPPRSVCNACFANGLDHYRDMYESRPDDWAQAVAVDEAVRDWSQIGVKYPVYVSKTLTPLRELAANDFNLPGRENAENEFSCDSGYCFL